MPRHLLAVALAIFAATASAGAAPPDPLAGVTVRRDVTYATPPTGALRLDVYRSADARGASPVLLFFHGGGWIMGSKRDAFPEAHPAPRSAERSWPSMLPYVRRGLAVVSVDYRLARVAAAPAAVDDSRQALAWVAEHGAEYGLDPQRVVTIGASAGGHLALMVAFAPESPVRVRGTIDLYGITDVPPLLATADVHPWATEWIGTATDASDLARRMSPLTLVRPGLPPVLIVHSDVDAVVPYDQAERLAGALRSAGVSVDLVTLPGGEHGFLTPAEHERVERSVLEFLGRVGVLPEPGGARSPEEKGRTQDQQCR